MNTIRTICYALALSLTGIVWAGPIPENQESAMGLKSFDLPAPQTGTFEVSFDATPLADKIDVFTGISSAVARTASEVSAIVRFNDEGNIDVRNSAAFRADQVLAYSANKTYRVRMVIDVAGNTYSVFVTPPGQAEVPLAKNYAFRNQRLAVTSLGQIVLAGFKGPNGFFKGAHRVNGVSLK